jgi:ubiquinone biosynthesis protein UbiJ
VARSLLVDLDPGVAITAFMTGEIRVDGDLNRLMELQQSVGATLSPTVEQLAFIGELRALTR